jgi:hypothetical protein
MNPNKNQESGNDVRLDALLRTWDPVAPLVPQFRQDVWRRIERAQAMSSPALALAHVFARWSLALLPRPALAMAYLSLLLLLGAGFGWSQARQETARVTAQLSSRYAQALDPYQAVP